MQIATVLLNTIPKLSYYGSTSSSTQSNPIQTIKLLDFDDSLIFRAFNKNNNEEKINPIMKISTSIPMTKSESLCVKLSPDEPFIKIGNTMRHQHSCECTSQKNGVLDQKMASEMMGIIYWALWIWLIYQETSNVQVLTSTSSFAYV